MWIVGRGKHPVTWKTLIEVLYDIELMKTLAKEIETVKISCAITMKHTLTQAIYLYCCFVYTFLTMYFIPCPHPLQFYMMN